MILLHLEQRYLLVLQQDPNCFFKSTSSSVNSISNVESNNILFQYSEFDIYPNREDASKYNLRQLQIIMKHDIFCFNNLLNFVCIK